MTSPPSLTVPSAPPPRARGSLPLYAALAPIAGAVVLWLATGSLISLWLAALAPVMLGASALDARRSARREERRERAGRAAAHARAAEEIARQHGVERARLRARHPDVVGYLAPDAPVWRAAEPGDRLVVGRGPRPSVLRVSGGEGDAEALRLRERAGTLEDAPVLASAAEGIAVVGPEGPARAVVRALVLQACLALPPGALRVDADAAAEHPWLPLLPHASAPASRVLAVVDPGRPVPGEAGLVIARVAPGRPQPPRCRTVLALVSPTSAEVSVDGEPQRVDVEAVGAAQAERIAATLAARAAALAPVAVEAPVALGDLLPTAPVRRAGALPAVVGVAGARPFALDLVADGPHAIVVGVTGAGKSELLLSWILSLCAVHGPDELVLLLADFKGGTAFRPLEALPHVTGVLTDLDAEGARRAIESLRAEVRAREAALARAGARDVSDPGARLARLVIVVDEFAALGEQHPELLGVFTDIAARGRALGMHLVLGSQRAVGVFRDALLANCPLRICLRVTDPQDSRAVVGVEDAAALPGTPDARGRALVRRAADARPTSVRIARSGPGDLARAMRGHDLATAVRRPWVPPLRERIPLAEVRAHAHDPIGPDDIVLGLADEPERQRHVPVLLRAAERGIVALGTAGSGKTTALALVAAQARGPVHRVGPDLEQAWDAVSALADRAPEAAALVVADDVDALLARYPAEYAQAFLERLEIVVRAAGAGVRVALSAQRPGGPAGRVLELVPRRALLRMSSRVEYLAAGGDPAMRPATAPGRALLDGRAVQLALPDAAFPAAERGSTVPWDVPAGAGDGGLVGMVLRPGAAARSRVDALVRSGRRVVRVEDARSLEAPAAEGGAIVVGGPESWQREWRLLTAVREAHDLVIDAACAGEYRLLSGERTLPPYCAPNASRAWLVRHGAAPVRTTLPDLA